MPIRRITEEREREREERKKSHLPFRNPLGKATDPQGWGEGVYGTGHKQESRHRRLWHLEACPGYIYSCLTLRHSQLEEEEEVVEGDCVFTSAYGTEFLFLWYFSFLQAETPLRLYHFVVALIHLNRSNISTGKFDSTLTYPPRCLASDWSLTRDEPLMTKHLQLPATSFHFSFGL